MVSGPIEVDVDAWAKQQFGACELGDRRRTKRLVKFATQVAAHPDGETPDQTERWGDCKAAYRLFDQDDVSFTAILAPHCRQTRACGKGTWLLIGDTTELDFGIHRNVSGLGPTGDGRGRGFMLHSSLMIHAKTGEIVGLSGQELFYRKPAPRQSCAQRKRRERESEIWGRVIDQVGPPPDGVHWIHVLDAEADNIEVFCHLVLQRCDWVVRASQLHRSILTAAREILPLIKLLDRQPLAGTYELSVRAAKGKPARVAQVEVRFASLIMPLPGQTSLWMRTCRVQEIPMQVVEVREVGAPKEIEPLHWVLLTSESVQSFEDAWRVIEHYEQRPVIEDYHKALKTGCRVEERLYRTGKRLERVTALLSVVAVRLMRLKAIARATPKRPAREIVPLPWITMLQRARRSPLDPAMTVREFFRDLAKLGGFLGRRSDGEPGWITIWRGFEKLVLLVRGAGLVRAKCG